MNVPLRLYKIAKVRVTAPSKTWIRSKKVTSNARDSIPSVFHFYLVAATRLVVTERV